MARLSLTMENDVRRKLRLQRTIRPTHLYIVTSTKTTPLEYLYIVIEMNNEPETDARPRPQTWVYNSSQPPPTTGDPASQAPFTTIQPHPPEID